MDEATKQILLNQCLILRCFLYDEKVILKDEIQQAINDNKSLIYPPSLTESKALNKERDDLMGNDAKEVVSE